MYYFLDENDEIIGSGVEPHTAYKNVEADVINKFDVSDPYGYFFKAGQLVENPARKEAQKMKEWEAYKEQRRENIARAVVTTKSGKSFDADEASQARMLVAIKTAEITGINTTKWKMSDNSTAEINLDELKEALTLAALKMSDFFVGESAGKAGHQLLDTRPQASERSISQSDASEGV